MDWRQTRATAILVVATIFVSALVILTGNAGYAAVVAGFIPAIASGAVLPPEFGASVPWWLTPLTATLLHANFIHLTLNLVMLFYCGQMTERALDAKGLVVLYVVGAYAAAAGQWLQDPSGVAPMIGASGAISAVIAAYSLFYGEMRAKPIGPVPASVIHVLWLAAAWIGIQLLTGLAGLNGDVRIAIGAHIGGFIAGLVLARPLLLWRYRGA
ncbi:rhomboid family intramembrane serine protease [Sphingomonas sp. PB4P5]|uniref:rhomboid family intramembrane serine protease n=1 Tax=Parasphingomonas puruogangriensis TaxID=3096155 RepID=UPI002FCA9B2C